MRNIVLVGLACLAVGILGALGYSHYLGEGKQLADLQDQLSAANTSLVAAKQECQKAKSETDAMSAQIQQLTTTKEDLKKQVDDLKSAASAAPAATPAPNPMEGIVKAQMKQQYETKILLLKTRLNLTPEQEATLRAAMDDEAKRTEAMTSQLLAGGKIDMTAFKGMKSVDQTLDGILTPDQKTAYAQMKTDEKGNSAETMASMEMNQMAPLLQLSETQKDQVGTALYQVQLNSQDPAWIKNNVGNTATNPLAILDAEAKAKEDALSKILTPEQLATYHQQAQSQLDMQKAMMQKFTPPQPALTPATAPASVPTN